MKGICPICTSHNLKIICKRKDVEAEDAKSIDFKYEEVLSCNNCGIVFLWPVPSIADLRRYYYEDGFFKQAIKAKEYCSGDEPSDGYKEFMGPLTEKKIELIKRYCDGSTLLHIGCDYGSLMNFMKKEGWNVFGVEPGRRFFKYTSEILGLSVKKAFFEKCCDEYEDKFFDVVIISNILHMVSDPLTILKKVKEKVKKHGIVYIEVPNNLYSYRVYVTNIMRKLKNQKVILPFHMPIIYYFTVSTIKGMLGRVGFRIELLYTANRVHENFKNFIVKFLAENSKNRSKKFLIRAIQTIMSILSKTKMASRFFRILDWLCSLTGKGTQIYAVGRKS